MSELVAAPKPLVRIEYGSGNPAGAPDWRPLNPWGQGFPKHLLNRKPRPQLYQLVVKDRRNGNKELRVGPKMGKDFVDILLVQLNALIASGAEKQWFDPAVVPVPSEM